MSLTITADSRTSDLSVIVVGHCRSKAPRLVETVAARIAKGADTLHASGIKGVPGTGIIAKGGCVQCSDDEVAAAVDFMVEKSQ